MLFLALAAIIFVVVYTTPGLFLARGLYAQQARALASTPVQVVPPMPKRPRIKMNEMLHIAGPSYKRCAILEPNSKRACNCEYRKDWVDLKNAWRDYDEWQSNYGHIKNGVFSEPEVDMSPIYLAVIGWPFVVASMFIKGGAKNIPDYRVIERIENELRELS